MDDIEWVSAKKIFGDLKFAAVKRDVVPVAAFALVQMRDPEGGTSWYVRRAGEVNEPALHWKLATYLASEVGDEVTSWNRDEAG